ncbi:MAG TPA: (d)CMP kinase [Trueperaceae bacterium]|nr:(d)CMP kinase [Trueperaceae bacterium]
MSGVEGGDTVITLDGPAASGKSSVAERVARRLGVPFVSSGLLYRAAAWVVGGMGADPDDEAAVLALLKARRARLEPSTAGDRVWVDASDVTDELHTDGVDAIVSTVARHPRVRAWVRDRLREIPGSFVIDGRDMGTVVFPEARFKFYLTAPVEVRAKRRVGERSADLEAVAEAIRRRDRLDARQLAPAEDAVHIDTGPMTLDEVVDAVMRSLSGVGAP